VSGISFLNAFKFLLEMRSIVGGVLPTYLDAGDVAALRRHLAKDYGGYSKVHW